MMEYGILFFFAQRGDSVNPAPPDWPEAFPEAGFGPFFRVREAGRALTCGGTGSYCLFGPFRRDFTRRRPPEDCFRADAPDNGLPGRTMLAILDYKAGNQTSVRRALDHLGIPCAITADPAVVDGAAGVIFPGVGAAGQAMRHLQDSGLDAVLRNVVSSGRPLLGICLGCQIMVERSEENDTRTLGLVEGRCVRFDERLEEGGAPIRIPHMGWNTLSRKQESPILKDIPESAAFYFVHSYYVETAPEKVIATSAYGTEFCAVYGQDGLWAIQFHPEKSGRPGLKILSNFYEWCMARHAGGRAC